MKKTPPPLILSFARVLACSVTAAALVLGCGTERSDDAPVLPSAADARPDASGGADLGYESLLALLGNPDGFERARKLAELLPKLGPGSLPPVKMVLKQTATAEIELGAADYELLMRFWARHDPKGASEYAFGASPRGYRVGAIHATIRQWMTVDPLGAIDQIRHWTRQEGDFGAATQIALVRGWYDSGQKGIEDYIRDLGPSFERQRAISTYLIALAQDRGGDAVVDWAEAQMERDPSFRLDAFRGAGDALIAVDVEAAQRLCDAHCEQPHGDNVRTRIAMRWVEVGDPRKVFAWLEKAPRNDETDLAVRRSFVIWADLDRRVALSWLESQLGDGEAAAWITPALDIYVRLLGREAPTEGLAVAQRYFTGSAREFWMVEILRFWRQQDEPAAEAWLSRASLSAETLAKVRKPQTEYEGLIIKHEIEKRQLDANRALLDTKAAGG